MWISTVRTQAPIICVNINCTYPGTNYLCEYQPYIPRHQLFVWISTVRTQEPIICVNINRTYPGTVTCMNINRTYPGTNYLCDYQQYVPRHQLFVWISTVHTQTPIICVNINRTYPGTNYLCEYRQYSYFLRVLFWSHTFNRINKIAF